MFLFRKFLQDYVYLTVAICNPECKNNGTCSEPDTCVCENGYSGGLCEVNCKYKQNVNFKL